MNYSIRPYWDTTLAVVFTLGDVSNKSIVGLVYDAVLDVTGAPIATAGKFLPGALVRNVVDGTLYINTGSTASPTFTLVS